MIRNLNLKPQTFGGSSSSAAAAIVASSAGALTPDEANDVVVSATGAAGGAFSIYSRNIRFDQDYQSNYSYHNTKFTVSDTDATPLVDTLLKTPSGCGSGGVSPLRFASAAGSVFTSFSSRLHDQQIINNNNVNTYNNNNNSEVKNSNPHTGDRLNNINHKKENKQMLDAPVCSNGYDVVDDQHNYSKPSPSAMEDKDEDEEEEDDDVDEDDDDDVDEPDYLEEAKQQQLAAVATIDVVKSIATAAPSPPDHHARRPMNAFLIFCKRHRGIVRERYPNLENRAITKILGDWWANIDANEKLSFTSLAKQYKDAFFNANPTFQWYKLPAPPLRTLTQTDRPSSGLNHSSPTSSVSLTPFSSSLYEYSTGQQAKPESRPANVGLFKLADEAQMGGLNSLMMSGGGGGLVNQRSANGRSNSNSSNSTDDADLDNQANELQKTLSETRKFLTKTMSTNRTEPFCQYHLLSSTPGALKRKSDTDISTDSASSGGAAAAKRANYSTSSSSSSSTSSSVVSPHIDFERFVQANFSNAMLDTTTPSPIVASSPVEDYDQVFSGPAKKSSRACKGKRYLEFMNTVKMNAAPKRPASSTNTAAKQSSTAGSLRSSSSSSSSTSINQHHQVPRPVEYEVFDHMYASLARSNYSTSPVSVVNTDDAVAAAAQAQNGTGDAAKQFDANDFDLDGKIKALTALNLDQYLLRKRDTKKKRKISIKRNNNNNNVVASTANAMTTTVKTLHHHHSTTAKGQQPQQPQTIQEAKAQIQRAMVGSQKRKARKESITRRDVAATTAADSIVPLKIFASGVIATAVDTGPRAVSPEVAASSLFILAEVASSVPTRTH